ncbi:unnamed protein product [Ambrosiozyma monospora]|uniref:Unnamed protein product n=1 Tax=Ambrosiozyma monospora TaxID=43982 RepID=A0ACB5T2K6_AMBMO|nr:unnamed protein product [Ambrosiozyma monospora]
MNHSDDIFHENLPKSLSTTEVPSSQASPSPTYDTLTAHIHDHLPSDHQHRKKANSLSEIKILKRRKTAITAIEAQEFFPVDTPEGPRFVSDFTETTTIDDIAESLKATVKGQAGHSVHQASYPLIYETQRALCL